MSLNIRELPDDIMHEIYEWLPYTVVGTLTKTEYIKNHCYIQERVRKNYKRYRRFIRCLIRQDNVSLFETYLELDGVRWSRFLGWYEDGRHRSYLHFLRYLATKFESCRCLYVINMFMERYSIYL